MTSGGARAKSGPPPTPGSGRSDARGMNFKALPAEGYNGEIPEFPRKAVHGSEMKHWNAVWRTPQASLWATPQWSFMIPTVALYCSLMAQSETPEYPVGILSQIRGLAGEILLTNDALTRAGYTVSVDELGERREGAAGPTAPKRGGSRGRLKVAGDGR